MTSMLELNHRCLLIFLFIFTTETFTGLTCSDTERRALIGFKQSLTDPSGRLSSWAGSDCCQWHGIECNNITGHVTRLNVRNPFPYTSYGSASLAKGEVTGYERSCLGGTVDSSLVGLKYLEFLDLSLNNFQGSEIPKSLGMLKNLRYLNLSFSSFGGDIPPHIGNLSNLNYLDLNSASLTNQGLYELRSRNLLWLSGLSSLKLVNMGQVNLDDVGVGWFEAFNMLPSLMELYLSSCNLQALPLSLPSVNFTKLSILDLSFNAFNSSLPYWLNLTSLTRLDLRVNSFRSGIPKNFANLTSLQYLDLSGNSIVEEQIPRFLGKLCKLEFLDLSGNKFMGCDEFFGGFSACPDNNLAALDLSACGLAGELPDSFGMLRNLQQLRLDSNSLWGSIPISIGNLSALKVLDISFNNMNGTIPESFGQLSELTDLYLQANPWQGVVTEVHLMNLTRLQHLILFGDTGRAMVLDISYEWIPPFRLISLHLQGCLVGPRFPAWLRVQSELTKVTLKNVGIEDFIPEEWYSKIVSNLTYLDLSNNQIKGSLPSRMISPQLTVIDLSYNLIDGLLPVWSTNASHFYLQRNSFTGSIPSNIDELMPQVMYMFLSENHLNGTIPSSICKMSSLQVLSLRDNELSGELPQCWNESQPLWVLDVANNNLSGTIPGSAGLLSSLNILMLSNNSLVGEIPPSLQNCSGLTSLDLGGNRLSGELPSWIGETGNGFWMIRLRSNLFTGTIPSKWCNLQILHILDLAQNNLSGTIPTCLWNLTSLIYGNSSTNYNNFFRFHQYIYVEQTIVVAKGQELEYSSTLQYVNIIDLSGNSLVGEIPEGITKLTELGTLNLSRNHLTGSIPRDIGKIRWLETLDISNNNLSGPIPQSISSLTSLSHMNLSHNNLEGRIPTGSQLQTLNDPSIYTGNPFLCGVPLPRKCRGDADEDSNNIPPANGSDDVDSQDSEMKWFYISMASGYLVGLLCACCTLWMKETWRNACFRFAGIA